MPLNKGDLLPTRDPLRKRAPKKSKEYTDEDLEDERASASRKQKAAETKLRSGPLMERCEAILDLLSLRPDGFWFLEPVSVEDVPDYLDVVESPMDYSTIKAKLKASEYADDHLAFAADVRLVFANALKYNYDRTNQCHIAAKEGMKFFEASFARALGAEPDSGGGGGGGRGRGRGGGGGGRGAGGGRKRKEPDSGGAASADSGERTQQLLRSLAEYLEACGGTRDMVDGWYTKTEIRREGNTAGTSDTYFFNPQGKRFRSRAEIARFFELEAAPRRNPATEAREAEKAAAREAREAERAKRDADLEKAREFARRYPIADGKLPSEPPPEPPLSARPSADTPTLDAFPASAVGGLLAVADFLSCLGAELGLPVFSLTELAAVLSDRSAAIPEELQQLNLLLTQMVLADEGAQRWWPDETRLSAATVASVSDKKTLGGKRGWWESDAKPPVKCNLQAILASTEPPSIVRRWVSVLEQLAPLRTNTGAPIKAMVDAAMCVTRDKEVKRFLSRAIKHFKGNAAGTTKHAGLWLAAQVRRNRPELWTKAALEAEKHEAPLPPEPKAEGIEDDDDDEEEEDAPEEEEQEPMETDGDGGGEAAAEADEAEAGGEEEEEEGEEESKAEVVDRKLWDDAAAEGWMIKPKGKQGRKWCNWVYIGPSGTRYNTKSEAAAARESEATATAEADEAKLGELQKESVPPEELVGTRVSVLWREDDDGAAASAAKEPTDDDWYSGQLVGYDADKGTHTIFYDDGSKEEVDLQKETYRRVYQLQPPALAVARRAPRPNFTDASYISWPVVAAASVVRLRQYWQPEAPPLRDDFEAQGPLPALKRMPTALGQDATPRGDGAASPLSSPAKLPLPPPSDSAPAAAGGGDDESSDDEDTPLGKVAEAMKAKAQALAPTQAAGKVREDAALACLQDAVSALLSVHPSEATNAYARLRPEHKLGLLLALVEGVVDTKAATTAAESKNDERARVQAGWEAQDREEKRAAKQKREQERAAVRAALDAQLAQMQMEGAGGEGEVPTEVTEQAVSREMMRLAEAEACGGQVTVMSLDALYQAESELAVALELQAAGVDGEGWETSRRRLAAASARRDEMRRRRDTLRGAREAAIEALRSANMTNDVGRITAALHQARNAALEGSFEQDGLGPGGHWLVCEVRDAYMAIGEARKAHTEATARGEREAVLRQLRTRSEMLGCDRWGRRYWHIDGANVPGGGDGRSATDEPEQLALWVQPCTEAEGAPLGTSVLAGPPPDAPATPNAWQRLPTTARCEELVASLDVRGVRERALRAALKDSVAAARAAQRAAGGADEEAPAEADESNPEPMEE